MSRRGTVLIILLLVTVWGETWLIARSPPFRKSADIVARKLAGRIPHVKWSHVIQMAVPDYLRPSWLRPIVDEEAYLSIPVTMERRAEGPCAAYWETPLGGFWASPQDGDLLAFLLYEQLEMRIYDREPVAIQSGDIVLDAGAHVGVFVRFALNKGALKVVAFEPDPRNIDCLKCTFSKEISEGRLLLVEAALWDRPGSLKFHLGDENTGASAVRIDGEVTVPAITIDDAVQQLRLERVDFIKMDIEGAERHALAGGRDTIARFSPRMALCTYHHPDDPVIITEQVLRIQPSYRVFATRKLAYFH